MTSYLSRPQPLVILRRERRRRHGDDDLEAMAAPAPARWPRGGIHDFPLFLCAACAPSPSLTWMRGPQRIDQARPRRRPWPSNIISIPPPHGSDGDLAGSYLLDSQGGMCLSPRVSTQDAKE